MEEKKTPEPWKARLIDEHRELLHRLIKLIGFMSSVDYLRLDYAEQAAMETQKKAMEQYLRCLTVRVYLLSKPKPEQETKQEDEPSEPQEPTRPEDIDHRKMDRMLDGREIVSAISCDLCRYCDQDCVKLILAPGYQVCAIKKKK